LATIGEATKRDNDLAAVREDLSYAFAMARLARIVVPGCPHHVTQRGNRRAIKSIKSGRQDTQILSTRRDGT